MWLLESSSLPLWLSAGLRAFLSGSGVPAPPPSPSRGHSGRTDRTSLGQGPWGPNPQRPGQPAWCFLQVCGRLRPANSLGSQPAPWRPGLRPFPAPPPPPPGSTQLLPGLPSSRARHPCGKLCEQAARGLMVSMPPVTTCELGRDGLCPVCGCVLTACWASSRPPCVASQEPRAPGWVCRALEGPVDPALCHWPWSRAR